MTGWYDELLAHLDEVAGEELRGSIGQRYDRAEQVLRGRLEQAGEGKPGTIRATFTYTHEVIGGFNVIVGMLERAAGD